MITDRRVGRLLSANVGLPHDVAWHGRTVHTAVWKQPVDGPQMARRLKWGDGYASLLELAEACDVPVRWSCRTGVCHTCETALLSGAVSYTPDPVDDPADGSALICCSRPDGDLTLDL